MSSSDQSKGDRSRDEVIAGEYVLGVLSLADRRIVEERMRRDKVFALIVRRWEDNLSTLDEEYVSEMPPVHLFPEIEDRVFGPTKPATGWGVFSGVWNSLFLWRSTALTLAVAAAAYGFYQSNPAAGPQVAKPLMAELSGEGAAMVSLMARYDSQSGRLAVMPVAAGKSEEKSLELWIVDSGGKTHSLGVLPQTGEGEVIVPADMRASFGEGIVLAVSLEPFGGSPTGVATGPVIAAGKTYAP